MHDIKKQMQFIELRTQGNSYQKISKKIGVSKQTLLKWSKLASTQARVAELETLEFDAIKEVHGLMKRSWVEFIARTLQAMMKEMDRRNEQKHTRLTTHSLLVLMERLKARLDEETTPAESELTEASSWGPHEKCAFSFEQSTGTSGGAPCPQVLTCSEEQSSDDPLPSSPDDNAEPESAGNQATVSEELDRLLTISRPVVDDSEQSTASMPNDPSPSGRRNRSVSQ